MSGHRYDDEVKAKVLQALARGIPLSEVARSFGIGKATVSAWRDDAKRWGLLPTVSERSVVPGTEQGSVNLGAKVAEYVAAALDALTAQARAVGEPAWIAQQSAVDLLALHRGLGDQTIRILSALRPVDVDEPGTADEPAGDVITVEAVDVAP